jgi:hypothetical protein
MRVNMAISAPKTIALNTRAVRKVAVVALDAVAVATLEHRLEGKWERCGTYIALSEVVAMWKRTSATNQPSFKITY